MNKTRQPPALQHQIDELYDRVVALRREIHRNPELSGQEQGTAARICAWLREIGLKPRLYLNKTGITTDIVNGPGPLVVLRADTDALPIEEKNRVPFASTRPGVMHACGHDMHTAALCGGAALLASRRHEWQGTVRLLFQPSEESEPGGAIQMIRAGAFPAHARAVIGLHVSPEHPAGHVGIKSGHECTAVGVFELVVCGKGGHGAMPEKSIDPIPCACAIVSALQTIISRETAPAEPAVITIGTMHAGTKNNVIPDTVSMGGSIRTFSQQTQKHIVRRIRQTASALAAAHRCSATLTFTSSYPAGYNDPQLAALACRVLPAVLGAKAVISRQQPIMYSEDFTYYQQRCPGLFIHLGVRPGKAPMSGLHSATFLPDESALKTAMAAHYTLATAVLCSEQESPSGQA